MSDLISRKSVIEKLEKIFEQNLTLGETNLVSDIVAYIMIEPTAYDIDKVVDELEKAKTISVDIGFGMVINTIRKDVVLEIVKQGSVSDDVCEWKKSEEYPFDWIVGCDGCEVNHRQGVYCPCCGKKIKVVE